MLPLYFDLKHKPRYRLTLILKFITGIYHCAVCSVGLGRRKLAKVRQKANRVKAKSLCQLLQHSPKLNLSNRWSVSQKGLQDVSSRGYVATEAPSGSLTVCEFCKDVLFGQE